VKRASGAVTFTDPAGAVILAEIAVGRPLPSAVVGGRQTHNARQQWTPAADESLYGLGQHQQGLLDIKDYDFDFHQYNTEVFVPFLVSSRGYGILWDNTSFTRFGDLGQPGQLPGIAYAGHDDLIAAASNLSADVTTEVEAPAAGDYTFSTYSSGAIRLDVDGARLIDHWRQGWLPSTDVARVRLEAGQRASVHLQWTADGGVPIASVLWKPPVADRTTSLWSEVADGIDYTFVYGPELDDVIAGYRLATGAAPLLPKWAYGFWQSCDHYQTQQESLEVLDQYRARRIPIDVIVQDWQYWPDGTWGSHQFDASRFPDPTGWIASIHDQYHAHLMISVWGKFVPGTSNFDALNGMKGLYPRNLREDKRDFQGNAFTYYDAFNAGARGVYWSQVRDALMSKGVDAWWADATEPDIDEDVATKVSPAAHLASARAGMDPTAGGPASALLNAYSLAHSEGLYEGQRAAAPDRRVLILTRSAFAGQQRYGAVVWSGDITSTWTAMRKQIAAGLGLSISGLPYWTMDAGGYALPARFATATPTAADLDEWRELNARWFEMATFAPILRVHGQAPLVGGGARAARREIYAMGGDTDAPAYEAELKFVRLRYRLLPYIYSLAGMVTHESGTIMRPLAMDFRDDPRARAVADQYMFGPALLVCPVTSYGATSRAIYLPEAAGWYDLWTGARFDGGAADPAAAAPLDAIPVFARAGSIIPVGPDVQYVDEQPADPITLFVYAGVDGAFTLYEDQGTTTDYERGAFARIPLRWDDAARTLTIGERQGSYGGMPGERTFQLVLVDAGHPRGLWVTETPIPDETVSYDGRSVDVRLGG
jgi:alpha-D-xyloside xylohydrolase